MHLVGLLSNPEVDEAWRHLISTWYSPEAQKVRSDFKALTHEIHDAQQQGREPNLAPTVDRAVRLFRDVENDPSVHDTFDEIVRVLTDPATQRAVDRVGDAIRLATDCDARS